MSSRPTETRLSESRFLHTVAATATVEIARGPAEIPVMRFGEPSAFLARKDEEACCSR